MAAWLHALACNSNFSLSEADLDGLTTTADLSSFAFGLLLRQDFSKKHAYDQLQTVAKAARVSLPPIKLGLIAKFFQLLNSVTFPIGVYAETRVCLLMKDVLRDVAVAGESVLWRPTVSWMVRGVTQLVAILEARDSLDIVRKTLQDKLALLGEDVIMMLNSDDSAFLTGGYAEKTETWVTERVANVVRIVDAERNAGRLTLLSPLLYIAVKSSPMSILTPRIRELLGNVFTIGELTGIEWKRKEKDADQQKEPAVRQRHAPQTLQPPPAPQPTSKPSSEFRSVLDGVKWLYNKVLTDVENSMQVDLEQIAYECERFIFGQSAPLVKDGKQDLFEAFDALMGQETATKDSVNSWKLMLRGFGRLQVLEQVEWDALQEKLSRLAHRNQFLRDIGRKQPNRPRRERPTVRKERKLASEAKRGLGTDRGEERGRGERGSRRGRFRARI